MKSPRTFRIALSTTLLAGLASALPPAFATAVRRIPPRTRPRRPNLPNKLIGASLAMRKRSTAASTLS